MSSHPIFLEKVFATVEGRGPGTQQNFDQSLLTQPKNPHPYPCVT